MAKISKIEFIVRIILSVIVSIIVFKAFSVPAYAYRGYQSVGGELFLAIFSGIFVFLISTWIVKDNEN